MNAVIRKWGNSLALRLPSTILKEAGYWLDQKVNLTVSNGRIIIQPLDEVVYDIANLVNAIDDQNTHEEFSFGSPVGKEKMQ